LLMAPPAASPAAAGDTAAKRKVNDRTIIAALGVMVVVLSILAYHFYSSSSHQSSKPNTAANLLLKMKAEVKPVVEPVAVQPAVETKPVEPAPVTVAPIEPLLVAVAPAEKIVINAQKDVWVKAQLDTGAIFDFLLRAGGIKKLEAKKEIKVLFGDASAVAVEYNNETITDLGEKGVTRSMVFPGLGKWKDAIQVR
ncbi:MAG: DUF4115 domain-containing protein, partial [Pseudomonadota bacterium]